MLNDRRKSKRQRVLKPATIVLPGGLSTLPCVVMDMSAGGALLKTDQWLLVPDRFRLDLDNGPTYQAAICHRQASTTGVRFVEAAA